jgi:hypothetical protein
MHEHLHRALNNFCFRREWVHPCRQPHCTTETHRRRACLTTQTEESSHFFLSWSVHIPRTPALGIFPYFDLFNQYLRIEPVQNFFFQIWLFWVTPVGMTCEGVTSCALAWLMGLARDRLPMWHQSRRILWCDSPVAPSALAWLSCGRTGAVPIVLSALRA